MSAGSQPRQVAATGAINPPQAPAVAMVTSTSQPFAAVPEGATEAKRRRISPSKAQVWALLSQSYFVLCRMIHVNFSQFSYLIIIVEMRDQCHVFARHCGQERLSFET